MRELESAEGNFPALLLLRLWRASYTMTETSMVRSPLSKQRSKWVRLYDLEAKSQALIGVPVECWGRNVTDGTLRVLIDEEPWGWHLSISHAFHNEGRGGRYPTWDEIADARYNLLPEELDFVMHLPPPDEYVALHDTTFHLHENPERPHD
jgi:hypothetical protein